MFPLLINRTLIPSTVLNMKTISLHVYIRNYICQKTGFEFIYYLLIFFSFILNTHTAHSALTLSSSSANHPLSHPHSVYERKPDMDIFHLHNYFILKRTHTAHGRRSPSPTCHPGTGRLRAPRPASSGAGVHLAGQTAGGNGQPRHVLPLRLRGSLVQRMPSRRSPWGVTLP